MGHLGRDHGVREEDTQDLVRFFIGTMLPGRLKMNLQRTNGTQVRGEWNVERCHCPGCRYLHAVDNRIERHFQQHPDMRANIKALGWFWGTIHTMIREKPRAMIAEVLREGEAYQCTVPQCGQIFANERGIKAHFTGYHGALLQKDWTATRCKLIQRFELMGEGEVDEDADVLERKEGGVEVEVEMEVRMGTGEGGMEENAEGEISEEERHRPRMQGR
jgi:hypothetical protein